MTGTDRTSDDGAHPQRSAATIREQRLSGRRELRRLRLRWGVLFAVFLIIDGVAYLASQGSFRAWFHSWGHDIALPIWVYFLWRLIKGTDTTPARAALFAGFGCVAAELGQAVGLYDGTFDPIDIAAYGTGIGIALLVDRATSGVRAPMERP